ncbi:MAG: radical SAM protein [bacterium]
MRLKPNRALSLAGRGALNLLTTRPLCVSFEVTHACNARCKHCHLGGEPPEEKRVDARTYASLARQLKPVVTLVSGGEPLLRDDLEDIVGSIRQPNGPPIIALTTNGWLLSKERYMSLRRAGVDEFSISFDYPDQRHDAFRGIQGLYARIEAFARDLDGTGNRGVTLSCVIQRDNFRDIPGLIERAQAWGVPLNFSSYTWLRTKNKDYMLRKEDMPEFRRMVDYVVAFRKKNGVVRTSEYVFRRMIEYFENGQLADCRAGVRFCIVNPDGTFSPCGLIMRQYRTLQEVRDKFVKSNTCVDCYTSIRAGTERPIKYQMSDNIGQWRK